MKWSYDDGSSSDGTIDWIPGMRVTHLKDFSRIGIATDPTNFMLKRIAEDEVLSATILNTFDNLEDELNEFAWGLANAKHPFLWIVRRDIVIDGQAILPEDFMKEIEGRVESICGGVPMICCPQFGDQPINCRYTCNEWGIGVEISKEVRREEIERVVRGVMESEKGKEMRLKAMKWKESVENATKQGGSSYTNLNSLIHEVLQVRHD
ncbi:UDP-glycosyltransferase 85A7-like [Tasmannia lanceolata]|uniref:UDP-glycosyltransferase 85A7-like n=1 Tax=Tasmannia lanceolata TaxID=3420 RepID=UPI004063BD03